MKKAVKVWENVLKVAVCFTALLIIIGLFGCNEVKSSTDLNQLKTSEFPSADGVLECYNVGSVGEIMYNMNNEPVKDTSEMKAVWISYLEFDWALKGKSEEEFRHNIDDMFNKVKSAGLNTVIVQVRSHGDAYYNSSLYPYSKECSSTVGVSPLYDPLEIMVEYAKKYTLSIHAWINPFRLMSDTDFALLSDNFIIKRWYNSGENMAQADGMWYLDPASEQVIKLITDGVSEIIKNYEVDGIHIDDYFYCVSPESFGYDKTAAREYTTRLVKAIYDTVKGYDSELLFGVSPAGNYTDKPTSDQKQYTDLELWCTHKGYIDYVAPQIYWSFDDNEAPFTAVFNKWENLLKDSPVKLYVGLADYKFYGSDIIARQIDAINLSDISKGYIHFRYDSIF